MNPDQLRVICRPKSMTAKQLAVLMVCANDPKIKLRHVADYLGISRQCVTRSYDGLTRLGLIQRQRGQWSIGEDCRDVYGHPTENGMNLVKQLAA